MESLNVSLCDLPWWAVLASWLLPALLGYFWGMLQWSRYKSKSNKAGLELSSASKRIVNLENEINECRKVYEKVTKEKEKLNAELAAMSGSMHSNPGGAGTPSTIGSAAHFSEIIHKTKPVFGFAIKRNDLKIISGIDPNIEKLLHEIGIQDWHQLEKADLNLVTKVMAEAGLSPSQIQSWPFQSSLARQERWEELKEYQEKNK
ncbi:MAG: hypothetical protein KA109_01315 [Saprospiraceae bacterium]|jgi:predicted flap endonuclease-1-like 5' DNA nuclease|nr:hypothetical protein [Saprospiraceae bacterium]MBK6478670.1 hypothetical protein [Saprospiraceae bacterium]MBK6814163.1 hypothetical protein [Saprospiraceae bacterium]MBK7373606.1 hypothetical protein [Saprospiraceae bacterium]MBK7437277.1 hypothetical protein [Saprospiraceae bacterium]